MAGGGGGELRRGGVVESRAVFGSTNTKSEAQTIQTINNSLLSLTNGTYSGSSHLPAAGPRGNMYYPGFKRNFWLEYSSPPSTSMGTLAPTPPPAPPGPSFLHPGTNGSVQTVLLGENSNAHT